MNSKPQTFTVSLKVGGDSIKLVITVGDTIDEVFERLRDAYPSCSNKKT